MVDYAEYIRRRAYLGGVENIGEEWYARICSWFGNEPACVNVNITSIVDSFAKEEAERICNDKCYGDEECIEMEYDLCLEQAYENISESKMAEILAKDFLNELIEQALPDLIDNLVPRKSLLDYLKR